MAILAASEWSIFARASRCRTRSRRASRPEISIRGAAFLAFSPDIPKTDAYAAYEGSYTDGPFRNPGRYRRDNFNANFTRQLGENEKLGFRLVGGRNDFYSSGQLPLDLVDAGVARPLRLPRPDRRRPRASRHGVAVLQPNRAPAAPRSRPMRSSPVRFRPVLEFHFLPERSAARRRVPAARFAAPGRRQRAVHAAAPRGTVHRRARRRAPTSTTAGSTSDCIRARAACPPA